MTVTILKFLCYSMLSIEALDMDFKITTLEFCVPMGNRDFSDPPFNGKCYVDYTCKTTTYHIPQIKPDVTEIKNEYDTPHNK